ncbi:MAG: hypothetical protein K2N78_10975 [Oscillospiraceae bacterium]|nr:hypothetical protein [Oscillospiraceae bacterium]
MKREFLKNFQVNGQPLPDAVIDAIMQENERDLETAKANPGVSGGTGGKTFTQDEVNRIVSERLARDRADRAAAPSPADEREQVLKAREARLDCRDYLDSKKYPVALLDVLDTADVDKFKAAVETMIGKFPAITAPVEIPPPYSAGTGTQPCPWRDPIAAVFKP